MPGPQKADSYWDSGRTLRIEMFSMRQGVQTQRGFQGTQEDPHAFQMRSRKEVTERRPFPHETCQSPPRYNRKPIENSVICVKPLQNAVGESEAGPPILFYEEAILCPKIATFDAA